MVMFDNENLHKENPSGTPKGSLAMLLALILFCYVTELIGASFAQADINTNTWFNSLIKSSWSLPSNYLAPIRALMHLIMAFSAWFVWLTSSNLSKTSAYVLFAIQLVLNALWSGF